MPGSNEVEGVGDPLPWTGVTRESMLTPVEIAQLAMERNRAVINSPRLQPIFLWTWRPFSQPEIQDAVEAQGNSPYRLLSGWPEPRGLQVAGRPEGARHCYLLVVEVLARVVE